jgi:hypothetical protein
MSPVVPRRKGIPGTVVVMPFRSRWLAVGPAALIVLATACTRDIALPETNSYSNRVDGIAEAR